MLEFIQELHEARLYKGADTLNGKSADDLASAAYLMLLMLEVLRTDDEIYAKKYAKDTIGYENFEAMRSNVTDLHNIFAVLNNQNKYEDHIKENLQITVPVLQIRRYLRDITTGDKQLGLDKELFMKLERFLNIKDSTLKSIRRTVGDWNRASTSERSSIRKQLKNYTVPAATQNDILVHFKLITQKHEI